MICNSASKWYYLHAIFWDDPKTLITPGPSSCKKRAGVHGYKYWCLNAKADKQEVAMHITSSDYVV
jgi:hypothetical protein